MYEVYYHPGGKRYFFGATDDRERLMRWMNYLHNYGYRPFYERA